MSSSGGLYQCIASCAEALSLPLSCVCHVCVCVCLDCTRVLQDPSKINIRLVVEEVQPKSMEVRRKGGGQGAKGQGCNPLKP